MEISVAQLPLGHWRLTDKNRFEEDFRSSANTTRYENEIELFRPMRLEGIELEPYAKEQVKYDLRFKGWVYTRLRLGVTKTLTRKLSIRGFYFRQNGSHLSPGTRNGIGVTFLTHF